MIFGVICQVSLLRAEFQLPELFFKSDFRHRAASRRVGGRNACDMSKFSKFYLENEYKTCM